MKNKPLPTVSAPVKDWSACASPCGWTTFWFTAVNPIGLHVVRVLTGLLLLAWLLPLAGHIESLFGLNGWLTKATLTNALDLPQGQIPFIGGWSVLWVTENPAVLNGIFWCAIGVFALFTLGLFTRITSILTWVMVVSFLANPTARLEIDYMLVILTFYLMISYVLLGQLNGGLSPVERVLGPWNTFVLAPLFGKKETAGEQSFAANVALRLLQVHFAIIVVTSAFHKTQIGDWWSGVAFWYPLHPPFDTTEAVLRDEARTAGARVLGHSIVQYVALGWAFTFPLWAWRPRWRWLLLTGGLAACLFSGIVYKAPLFGVFFFIGCLSYLSAEEWLGIRGALARFRTMLTGKERAPASNKMPLGARS